MLIDTSPIIGVLSELQRVELQPVMAQRRRTTIQRPDGELSLSGL
jgi:hypothetical protein